MSSSVSIDKVGLEDLEAALDLLKRFFREEGFTPAVDMRDSLRTMILDPASAVFLARKGDSALGIATLSTSVGIEYGRSAELDDLYVLPAARGSGVASQLIEAVGAWCQRSGCTTLLVTVTEEGEAKHGLIDFYQERGFSHTGRVIMERRC